MWDKMTSTKEFIFEKKSSQNFMFAGHAMSTIGIALYGADDASSWW
jgi:hypothetical protein